MIQIVFNAPCPWVLLIVSSGCLHLANPGQEAPTCNVPDPTPYFIVSTIKSYPAWSNALLLICCLGLLELGGTYKKTASGNHGVMVYIVIKYPGR
jgi:hypothetical protein